MTREDNFYKKKLDNGLTVLFEKRSLPVVASSVSFKIGSEFESEEIKGISHFIEHLVFKGTKNRNQEQISREIEKKGGILNAFTSEEVTCFWNKLPSRHFQTGMEILSDISLNPLFEKETFEMERKVILEEIKMYHDSPQYYVLNKIKELLYKKPFGMSTAGTIETMSKVSRENIIRRFNLNYSPEKMILAVVGNANFEDICRFAENFPKKSSEMQKGVIVQRNLQLVEKRKGIEQANIVFGFHAPRLVDKSRYSAEILNVILAEGMSSRIFQEIREKRGLAYSVKGFLEQDKNYAYEGIYLGTMKDKIKIVKNLILKEFKKLQKLERRELEEAKEQLIGLKQIENENSEEAMSELISEENAYGAEQHYKYEEGILETGADEVKKLAKLKNYSFLALVPE